jgi:hypothetical protein
MALPQKLYAVVSHSSQPVTRKPDVVEMRANKLQELKTKEAIDRANLVLDRLEQRVAHYDAQSNPCTNSPSNRWSSAGRVSSAGWINWGIRSWQNCAKRISSGQTAIAGNFKRFPVPRPSRLIICP